MPCTHLPVIYNNNKCQVWLEVIENANLIVYDLLLCKATIDMIMNMWNIMNGFHSLPEFELDNNKNLKISLLFIPTFVQSTTEGLS